MAKVDSSFGLVPTVSVGMHIPDRLGPIFHPAGLTHVGNSVLEGEGYLADEGFILFVLTQKEPKKSRRYPPGLMLRALRWMK